MKKYHLLDFNGCFDCILKISHLNSVCFSFFELFDNILLKCLLGNSLGVGFDFICLAVELEFYRICERILRPLLGRR